MTRTPDSPTSKDVLEQNVSTLLETGGEPPRMSTAARSRIREELVATHGTVAKPAPRVTSRIPLIAAGVGLAAAAATAVVITRVAGNDGAAQHDGSQTLVDGTTYLTDDGGKVTVLGARHVRVEGAVLLDVARGKGTFVVETARGRIEVLGTRFLVDAQATQTTAAVVRGKVKLATEHGSVVIHAGEQAVAEQGKAPVRGPAPRLSHLVSWAQQARRRQEKSVKPLRNGSLFARDPGVRADGQFGEEYPLPIRQLAVDVLVEDRVARVAIDQTFTNPHDRVLEGVYKFAIPPDAALQRLAMYVDGTLTESAVVERMRARRIYEELVYRRIDPALLEYAGSGRLNLRVYPIPARQDKRLMIAYTQSLPKLYRDWTIEVPLPEVDQPVAELSVSARIAGCANCELTSPGNQISVERTGNDAIVKLRKAAATIGDSFVVHVREDAPVTTVAMNTDGDDRYLLVRAPGELPAVTREHRARTWVILDDVSASRSSYELSAQADLVDAFLRELDEDDKVAVVAFDVEARTLLPATRVDDVDRRAVRTLLREEGGVGATDFAKALDAAIDALGGVAPEDAMIVYLGDGVITSGARNLDALRSRLAGKAQFVGVGVGDGPDTETLDALASATGGYSTTIDLADDVRWRAFDLVAALHTARVTGVAARLVDASGGLVPAAAYLRAAQLAEGEEVELVAKLVGDATPIAVELTGTRNGAPWQQRIALAQPTRGNAGYLPRLWAQRHIAARLLAKHDPVIVPPCTPTLATRTQPTVTCPTEAQLRQARDEEIRKEVVTLGKQYFLLSRHTSLLVLENDAMYAKYGVRKGAGDTWAPYALPPKIPVVTQPVTAVPDDVAEDAELVRTPLQLFHDFTAYTGTSSIGDLDGTFGVGGGGGGVGTIGAGRGGGGSGFGHLGGAVTLTTRQSAAADEQAQDRTRGALGLSDAVTEGDEGEEDSFVAEKSGERFNRRPRTSFKPGPVLGKRGRVSTRELQNAGLLGSLDLRRGRAMRRASRDHGAMSYGVNRLDAARFVHASDSAFDDVTALIPALVPDAAESWRLQLLASAGNATSFPIDDAAKRLLASARENLATGIYRWGGVEIAVDAARRIGWRRTTETGLVETASFDGRAWTRRYAELGISATRNVREDDVALALAYLPIWIAEPEHYARWFVVTSRGARQIGLSVKDKGKDELAFVLAFDDQARLVSVANADGQQLLAVTWDGNGPTAARVLGGDIAVGFSPQAITDAAAWAHGDSAVGVVVELPSRLPAYWRAAIDKEQPGTPAWRHASRQLLVSGAAVQDRGLLAQTYAELRKNGGVELGDLVLASGGIAASVTDAEVNDALAPHAKHPLARYLLASRAYGKTSNRPARLVPETREGVIGALWSLRAMTAYLADNKGKEAAQQLFELGDRAFALRLVGAAVASRHYAMPAQDVIRMWNSVAVGPYKNLARAQAALVLFNHGRYEEAASQVTAMVDALDLDAVPARLDIGPYVFNYSRRGVAGGHLAFAAWRDRVLAGSSFEHVMALLPMAASHQGDLPRLFARATALAGDDVDKQLDVAHAAIQYGHHTFARGIVEPLLKRSPTSELYRLAASMARSRSDLPASLRYLEQAQEAGADEEVDVDTVRRELREIISLAHQIALQSAGRERDDAVARAMRWGARWRAIDPGNAEIDRQLGQLLLAVGDGPAAWRQLSSMIERDPWSGNGYATVAGMLEAQGKVVEALDVWQQAIVIDQTNPTHRLRKAQALIALGRTADGDALLEQITATRWHDMWSGTVYQAKNLLERGKPRP